MKVLLSGGTGYVGSHLVPALQKRGHTIALLTRKQIAVSHPHITTIYNGLPNLYAFCSEWKPDAVVHLAASVNKGSGIQDVDELAQANVLLPLHMAAAANAAGTELFLNITTFSTSSDTNEYHPQTLYAATKRACEDLLTYFHQSEQLRVCHLAFYDIYGPKQAHARFLNAVLASVLSNEPLEMTAGEQDICFLHVDDAVDAIIHCLNENSNYAGPDPSKFCVYGPEVFLLKSVPERVASALRRPKPEIRHERPYRKNEIMRFAPRYPLLPGWAPKIDFASGIKGIV
ncbi:CDP-abequose synthase [bacterium YEK0313]|nr:CDP-abequose synthase [bacterium YEK0313]